jgi:acetylornithine deacetylase
MGKEKRQELAASINAAVEKNRDDIVEFLRGMLRIPSVTGEEGKVQEYVAKHLRTMGLEVKVWDPDKAKMKEHPEFVETGMDYAGRPNVVGVYRGKGGRSLLLNGHTDVVTPEPVKKWKHDPWGRKSTRGNCSAGAPAT